VREFTLERRVHVDRPLDEVFEFFSNAANLERLTPGWLRFEIVTPQPIEMKVGALIDYRLTWRHIIPMRWRSEITVWDPPHRFVDEQRRGPYRQWIHEHAFEVEGDGTAVIDRVRYGVPGGWLVQKLAVGRDVEAIFAHRTKALKEIFG
jgi:ligand-binding SRPBCC domain-containing protein